LGKFQIAYLREGLSDPLHVWFYGRVFEVGGSNGIIFGFTKIFQSWRIQMATSPRRPSIRIALFRVGPNSISVWEKTIREE